MVHPADYRGKHQRLRRLFGWSLILLFLALPWIKIGGEPAILIDFVQRRFSLLVVRFWSH